MACGLFRSLAETVAKHFGYIYDTTEDENMTAYMRETMG